MSYVSWNDRLSVGNSTIDEQHKQLIAYLNQLHDAMAQGRETAIIAQLLGQLHAHSREHFEREELLWASKNYNGLDDHKNEHRDFIVKVLELNLQLHSGKPVSSLELLVFLRDWFVQHVATSDVAAARAIHATAPARFPWRWF
jgi:hemerythrin-like metal-binding protein